MRDLRAIKKYLVRGEQAKMLRPIGLTAYKIPVYGENVFVTVSPEHICVSFENQPHRFPDDRTIQRIISVFYDKTEWPELVIESFKGFSRVGTVHIYKAQK